MQSRLKNQWRRPAGKWLLISGVWTLIALLFTGESLMRSYVAGRPLSVWRALSWELFSCYVWLAFLPSMLWLGRRFPFGRGRWRRSLLIHALAGFILPLLQQAVDALVLPHLGYPPMPGLTTFAATYRAFLLLNFPHQRCHLLGQHRRAGRHRVLPDVPRTRVARFATRSAAGAIAIAGS